MFSRKEKLERSTGEDGIGRYEFLKQLITEFSTTTCAEYKSQTLANLANFAYDPINYEFMKQLHVIDLFLAQLSEDVEELANFALGGLCNISCDPESKDYIVSLNGVNLVAQYLCHKNEEISLNALTTLFYLFESKSAIAPHNLFNKIRQYESSQDSRFHNLGKIFIDTYSTSKEDVNK